MTYSQKKFNDIKFGKNEEENNKDLLEEYFKTTLRITADYCLWDFEDEEEQLIIEQKARRIKSTTYKSTLLDLKKYLNYKKLFNKGFFRKGTTKIYYIFKFIDGSFFITFEKLEELINDEKNIKTIVLKRGDIITNIEINIKHLTKIN